MAELAWTGKRKDVATSLRSGRSSVAGSRWKQGAGISRQGPKGSGR
jgi:hypothetical protein